MIKVVTIDIRSSFSLNMSKYSLYLLSSVSPFKGPRNLQTSEPSKTSFRVTWDHAPGDVRGYKVIFHPVGEDIDLGELLVGPYDNTVVLEELRWVFTSRVTQYFFTSRPCIDRLKCQIMEVYSEKSII